MPRRVVITGVGAVSPLGTSLSEIWQNWERGQSAIRDQDFLGRAAFPHGSFARTPDDSWEERIPSRKLIKFMSREAGMTAAAATSALADAGMPGPYPPERIGLYIGTGLTSCEIRELLPVLESSFAGDGSFSCRLLGEEGLAGCNPLLSFKILPNMTLCYVSMLHDIRGDNLVFNPWPGNTAQALVAAVRAVRWGVVDCALAGGGDCKTHFTGFLTLWQLGLLSSRGRCLPFDRDSDGLVPGEGAAVLVLEELERAKERGAPIYAEIGGSGETFDGASDTLFPRTPVFLEKAMAEALAESGAGREEIDGIFCSAGSHPVGDVAEARAVAELFPTPPPLFSLKPQSGDLLAASPALAAAAAAHALRNRLAPPAIEPLNPGPQIPSDLFSRGPIARAPETVLVNALDLGPQKVSLLIRRAA